ncbi:hypothetical protein GSI_13439 [Ganoderma sinense ZZ0214-1]|uniref:Uncharacterized protein n=1 Tax=Ganoderma sinense ZZ0214-1 TaxID=1077348 RepID=A0A2G8RQ98_9APHY|nr:hypothetical protein GSI_13439 [Ganoderma sinense ZZ0214-1]
MSSYISSSAINPLVHVYFFNPVTGSITYEPMRSPGAAPSNSPRLQYIPGQPKPRTLGKDTRGLIEDLPIRHNHAVYFIATPPSKWDPLTTKDRLSKIRRAKLHVRKMELQVLELEAALTQDDHDDHDDYESEDVSSCYSYDTSSLSIGDCSGESSISSIEESQRSRDSFSTDDSLSDHDTDPEEDEPGEHRDRQGDDKNEDDDNLRNNVASVTASVLPSAPSPETSNSLSILHAHPMTPSESPPKPLSRYLLSIPKTPSSLRQLTHPPSVDNVPSTLSTLGKQGERRSNKRKAEDFEDSRTVKRLKTAPPTDPQAPIPSAPVTDLPRADQQSTSLKRKREDDDDVIASGSSQQDNSDSGPAAKKLRTAPEPMIPRRRRRRPKVVRPLARKMWDKLMKTKLKALKLGATFSDFGFLPAKKTRRAA